MSAGADSKVWAFAWLYMMTTTNSYAIAYFLPIILRGGMGFDVASAQCLVAPPYVAAALAMFIQAYYADKWHVRGPIIVGNALIGKQIREVFVKVLTIYRHPWPWSSGICRKSGCPILWRLFGYHCMLVTLVTTV